MLRYLFFIAFICLLNINSLAQQLPEISVSNEQKYNYLRALKQNEEIVKFIEGALVENGLPKYLRNLPLIESGFNKNVISTANAGGIWQFMESHASKYGLTSADRFDIYHSTQIAMKSLKDMYQLYGNWITVVATYNCGDGTMKKAIAKANSDRYDVFCINLPLETTNHVKKFMEACSVTNELDQLLVDYNVSAFKADSTTTIVQSGNTKADPSLVSTEINASYRLDVIAEIVKIDPIELQNWNPGITEKLSQDGIATLYLPADKMPDFLLLKGTILSHSLEKSMSDDK